MERRHEHPPPTLRFRTSSAAAPAALFAGSDASAAVPPAAALPPARINLALSGWLQDRFPPPLPLASLSSSSAAAAGTAPATPTPLPTTTNLRFELAAVGRPNPLRKSKGGGKLGDNDDDDNDDNDNDLVGAAVRERAARGIRPPEAPDRAVAALERVQCSACAGPLVPAPGETSQARRRRAAALVRVCAGCRRAFHAPCADEVGSLLGGRTLLRLAPGAPPPWESPEGGGGLLAALTGHAKANSSDQQQQQRGNKDEGVTEELERLLREEEGVRQALARDGHWFHSSTCARVGAALAAQAAIGPVAIDDPPAPVAQAEGKEEGAKEGEAAKDGASGDGPAANAAPVSPFAWLKSMREAAMQRAPLLLSEEFEFDSQASEDVDEDDVPPLLRGSGDDDDDGDGEEAGGGRSRPTRRRQRKKGGGGGTAAALRRQRARLAPSTPTAPVEIQPRPGPPPACSRTWALVDLSRLRAEPGDHPPGSKGAPGTRLRPDVDALVDVLLQAYGPGVADEVVGLTAAALEAEAEEEAERERERAERRRAAAAAAGGAAVAPLRPRQPPRRRLGGGLRDGRYAVLLRDSAERGSAPLCAALLESYGPDAAVLSLLATRVSRRGEGHAAALVDTTASFLRDALGTRRMLASGVPAASDPVCNGLFLGSGGEQAVKREQARVQAELRRAKGEGGGGGGAKAAHDGDLVAGLLAVMGSPSLVPYVGKDTIYWSPPHAPRFRRFKRGEAAGLADALPALGRRLEAAGALGKQRKGVFGWLFGGAGGGGRAAAPDGSEWLVKELL
jgi:hypothetical protein